MKILTAVLLVLVSLIPLLDAKKSSHSRPAATASGRRGGTSSRAVSQGNRPPHVTKRRVIYEEEEDEFDDEDIDFPEDLEAEEEFFDEEEDDYEEEILQPRSRRAAASPRRPPPSSRTARNTAVHASSRKRPPPSRSRYEVDFEEDYGRPRSRTSSHRSAQRRGGVPPSSRSGRGGRRPPPGRSGSVVPYSRAGQGAASTFTRGLAAIRSTMPDPESVKSAALSSFKAARETTSSLSSNLYRDIKGLTSSELEQVMLKATKPDDTPVKGKHVERLVGVTYQISARYDIYDAVLRKLWAKMAEKDWRTTIKALYILHRFSADGAPDHAPALKARLRELRRTRDPKRKDKYFNSKQLLAGTSSPENIKFRAFMSRYAHYVLLRVQCFSGLFDEISSVPKTDKKKAQKPITSTSLRPEHLEAAQMLLKAGNACQLKDGEESENTAIACERVASDIIGLTSAVAIALNRALKDDDLKGADPDLLRKWCEFYKDELLPQARAMVKKTSPKLDAYGLFLPSRMGTSVSRELLDKGLKLKAGTAGPEDEESVIVEESAPSAEGEEEESPSTAGEEDEAAKEQPVQRAAQEEAVDDEDEFDEEYEYDEEEYYDDEEY